MQNLLMISLDTLRADVAYSGQFPAIERLRKRGVTFTNTISSAPLTPISHASVFTGLQPYNHGIRHLFKEQMNQGLPTIASTMKRKGYQTGAIVSCPGMNKWYGFCDGFDHYDDEIPKLADGSDPLKTVDVKLRGTALKRAPLVIERAQQWLEHRDQSKPFLLLVHFFDAHWPYEAPEKFSGHNAYEEEVAYMDHYLGVLLDYLETSGLMKKLSIVCFSDHGEDLNGAYPNDKGGEDLGHPEEFGHGCLLYDQTQKVPLIVVDPAIPENLSVSSQVRLVDIAPTISELLKLEMSRMDGESLVRYTLPNNNMPDLPAYSETMYPDEQNAVTNNKFPLAKNKTAFRIANRFKVINHAEMMQEYYDLEADPNELVNIILLDEK